MQGISWLYKQLLASQGGLCCMELVSWSAGRSVGLVGFLVDWLVR